MRRFSRFYGGEPQCRYAPKRIRGGHADRNAAKSAASFALTMWPPECSAAGVLRECRSDSASARLPAATSRSVGTKSTESAKKECVVKRDGDRLGAGCRLSLKIDALRSAFFGRTQKRRLLS